MAVKPKILEFLIKCCFDKASRNDTGQDTQCAWCPISSLKTPHSLSFLGHSTHRVCLAATEKPPVEEGHTSSSYPCLFTMLFIMAQSLCANAPQLGVQAQR